MRWTSKINIIYLIIISFIILSIQNADALQELNKTIQINEYYKQEFGLETGDILNLNLTTDIYADFFFLSEQSLIDYEINKAAKPSHVNWYKLNTTSFSENLTVDTGGTYFLIAVSKRASNSEYTNNTMNITESYDIRKQQIQVRTVSTLRKLGGTLMVILSMLLFFPVIIIFRKNRANAIFFLIFLIGLGFLIGDFHLFIGDVNQELNLLSNLLQGLITLLAIIVSINFVIAQVLSQMYTSATVKLVIRNPSFILYVTMNLGLIGSLIISLSDIDYMNRNLEINSVLLFRTIDFIIIAFILAIGLIIPYMYDTIQMMNPIGIIGKLIEDVTLNNLLKSSQLRRGKELSGTETSQKSNNHVQTKNIEFEPDSLQPIRDIANKAINESNYEILRVVSNKLGDLGKKYVLDAKINDTDKAIIAEHFGYHLDKIAETAIIRNDAATIKSIVNALLEINKASEKDSISYETIQYIGKIGLKCASNRLTNNIAYDVIDSLGELGEFFANNEWIKSTNQTLNEIYVISEELIQNELLISRPKSIMSSFYRVAKKAVAKQLDLQSLDALDKSQRIANRILNYSKDVSPIEFMAFLPLFEEVGTKLTDEMVILKGTMPATIDMVGKMGENAKDTEFIKKLTRTLIVVGIKLSKLNIAKENVLKVLVMLNSKNPTLQNEWDEVEKNVKLTDKDFSDKLKLEFLKSLQQNKKKSRRA